MRVRAKLLSFSVLLSLLVLSVAQATQQKASPTPRIKNFGRVSDKLYRGAQPKPADYEVLAAMGIKTVIDLQREGEDEEQQLVEQAGMKFFRIGMSDRSWPSQDKVDQFLKLVNDPANQPVFIHCRGGRHRTGAMTAIYRLTRYAWTADQAFAEMRHYDFEHGFGHGALKDYVYDYYSRMESKGVVVSTDNK
jgi:uncharacterized protein (TIGR01244 family)